MKTSTASMPTTNLPADPAATPFTNIKPAPPRRREPTFLQVFTLVLWLTCLAIGLLGLWIEGRPATGPTPPPPPEPPPMKAELIDVELTNIPAVLASADSPPPPPDATAEPPPPAAPSPLPEVAAPSPTIAFAVPVAGPARIVPAERAAPASIQPAAKPVIERLVYGRGTTTAQPQPDYPDDAKFGHQEGVVGIQFTVAPGGRVIDARVVEPSPWPLLNRSALQTVRDQWADPRWQPGHIYLVSIRFKLNQL
jgi:TonB family protein